MHELLQKPAGMCGIVAAWRKVSASTTVLCSTQVFYRYVEILKLMLALWRPAATERRGRAPQMWFSCRTAILFGEPAMHALMLVSFDEFLTIARQEPEPMRLLLVFARNEHASAPAGAHVEEAGVERLDNLTPAAIVDKDPVHLKDYSTLAAEAQQMVGHWDVMFVAALFGQDGQPITMADVDEGGEKMVQAIRKGATKDFLTFDAQGQPIQLS